MLNTVTKVYDPAVRGLVTPEKTIYLPVLRGPAGPAGEVTLAQMQEYVKQHTASMYIAAGSINAENLTSDLLNIEHANYVYNVVDDFTTNELFVEPNTIVKAGTNIAVVRHNDGYKFDILGLFGNYIERVYKPGEVYANKPDGSVGTIAYSVDAHEGTLVIRDTNGNIIVPLEQTSEYHAASVRHVQDNFVHKMTLAGTIFDHVYASTPAGASIYFPISSSIVADAVAQRTSDGHIFVPLAPTLDTHAASVAYVNAKVPKIVRCY